MKEERGKGSQLSEELKRLRKRVAELEQAETERKQAEEMLRETRDYLENLINYANAPIIVWDPELRITRFNRAFEHLTGYKADEVISQELPMLFPEASRDESLHKIARTLSGEYWESIEIPILRKDGETRLALWNSANIYAEDGKTLLTTIAQGTDITERERAEEALRERTYDLGERVKELNCLYSIADLVEKPGISLEEILQGTVDFILPAWQYPEITCARIIIEEQEFRTGNFRETVWRQTSDIVVYGERIGSLEVCYLEERPESDEGPFLKEERNLLNTIAERLGDITKRKQVEEAQIRLASAVRLSTDSIVLSDIEGKIIGINEATLEMYGTDDKGALIGKSSFDLIAPEDREKAIAGVKKVLEKGYIKSREYQLITKNGGRIPVEMSVACIKDMEGKLVGFVGISRDITERKRAEKEREQNFERLQRTLEGTVHALAAAVEMKDPYTAGHQRRVTQLACSIAEEMGLSEDRIAGIHVAGLIHDIGKINVPAEILSKPGPLNDTEYNLTKYHPQVGHDILNEIDFPWPVTQIVLQHHERMDGSGYPQGLKGEEILLEARILGVADAVEAMSSHRPYRPARGIDKALEEIAQNKGKLYDSKVVDACLQLFAEDRFHFEE